METLSFQFGQYEGPLDLLLDLIAKHKLNLYDIEITSLVEQYMQAIRTAQAEEMELASEFLEMASRLVYMKTVMLLPKHEEEKEQLRQELQGQLIEYQLCRQVAGLLQQQYTGEGLFVREPMELPADPVYKGCHPAHDLVKALLAAAGKQYRRLPPKAETFEPLVSRKVVSVQSRIFSVLRRLVRGKSLPLAALFEDSRSRSELVATFLAVLELMKAKRLLVDDQGLRVRLQRK